MRGEPVRLEQVTAVPQVFDHVAKILLNKVGQHKAVMEFGAPAHEGTPAGLSPETGNERAKEELLGQTHARVRRHFKGAQLDETEPAAAGLGRVELVDAEFGPVRVARHVDEQVAKDSVH